MSTTIPELRATLDAAASDSERLAAIHSLVDALLGHDLQESLVLLNEGLALAERLGNEHDIAHGMNLIGYVNLTLGKSDQALRQFECARELYERLGDKAGIAKTEGGLGQVHGYVGEYAKALEQYQSA